MKINDLRSKNGQVPQECRGNWARFNKYHDHKDIQVRMKNSANPCAPIRNPSKLRFLLQRQHFAGRRPMVSSSRVPARKMAREWPLQAKKKCEWSMVQYNGSPLLILLVRRLDEFFQKHHSKHHACAPQDVDLLRPTQGVAIFRTVNILVIKCHKSI